MTTATRFDYIVIGAGSAGCAVAAGLAKRDVGTVLVIEAGGADHSLFVKIPMGLVRLMGHKTKDWRYMSTPQKNLKDRTIKIPRGRLVGGSGSINSMVWFRGCRSDFDHWGMPQWESRQVMDAFEEVESKTRPARLENPHPLSQSIARYFGQNNPHDPPTPERHSGAVTHHNLHDGRRWSAADAFLRPAMQTGLVTIRTGCQTDRIRFESDRATAVILADGTEFHASKGIVLSAGAIGSPEILMRSGIGDAAALQKLGIDPVVDSADIGQNLHDHPTIPIHYAGPGSGYGIGFGQIATWLMAPFQYAVKRSGPWASPTVEACAFFAATDADQIPEFQMHFLPFMVGWKDRQIVTGQGYLADVCLCQPKSRGALTLTDKNPRSKPNVDLGLFNDSHDLERMVVGFRRLRQIMSDIPFARHRAPEAFPGKAVTDDDEIKNYIKTRAGTAYHPVGTVRMGNDTKAPVTPELAVRGIDRLWVADASVMPRITSANTNAPSMMIGHRAAEFIARVG